MKLTHDELSFLEEMSRENSTADFERWVTSMEDEYGNLPLSA